MIWLNPWAWLGLATLAIPVLIHLLGRRSANPRRFPSLRFLEASPLMATRRTRLTDLPLLAVRIGILAAAVAALADPLILLDDPDRDPGRALTRVIVVDTSASMMQPEVPAGAVASDSTAAPQRAIDVARLDAARLGNEARTSVILQTRSPATAMHGAAAWLASQHGRRELIVVSDFQAGTIDSTDLAAVPPDIGIGLARVESPASAPIEIITHRENQEVVARVVAGPDSNAASGAVTVEWAMRPITVLPGAAPSGARPPGGNVTAVSDLLILAGADEGARADAAARAAITIVGDAEIPAEQPIAIVHRGFEPRSSLLRDARPLATPWQGDLLARVATDSMLLSAAFEAAVPDFTADTGTASRAAPLTVAARTRAGEPVVLAAADRQGDRDRLLFFLRADAGSLTSAALVAAVTRASAPLPDVRELNPDRIPESVLAEWRRPAGSPASAHGADDFGDSDARWFWAIALLLLGLETWVRGRGGRRTAGATGMVHDRAA